jgi:hypothetical protein
MNKLDNLLYLLETNVSHYETLNQKVSEANVGWHIEHSLLSLNVVTNLLIKSNPNDYTWKFNFIRLVVLTMKKIPRGKAKSPEVVLPKGIIDKHSLLSHISLTRNKINELKTLSKDKYFEHPFFGKLKLKQTINFLEIHTKHHLEIIEDIINK